MGHSLFQEIQSLLTNWKGPDLTSYGELVLEGTFRIQRAKNERTLFLFDKLLLITKKRDDTFTYKAHILVRLNIGHGQGPQSLVPFPSKCASPSLCSPSQCGNLMLVEVIPKEPLSFSVFHYKNPKLQHTVQVAAVPSPPYAVHRSLRSAPPLRNAPSPDAVPAARPTARCSAPPYAESPPPTQ